LRAAFFLFLFSQMNTFLSERSASGKSGGTASPMASFTRFMIAVTVAFVALCAALIIGRQRIERHALTRSMFAHQL
jgi:hypothetical protein